jgi:hypothetical protein
VAPAQSSSPPTTATASPPTAAAGNTTDACAAFQLFYNDLRTHTSTAVDRLLPEAKAVQTAAMNNVGFQDATAAEFLDDANELLAYVQQPDFSIQGTVSADPVQQMVDDCS